MVTSDAVTVVDFPSVKLSAPGLEAVGLDEFPLDQLRPYPVKLGRNGHKIAGRPPGDYYLK